KQPSRPSTARTWADVRSRSTRPARASSAAVGSAAVVGGAAAVAAADVAAAGKRASARGCPAFLEGGAFLCAVGRGKNFTTSRRHPCRISATPGCLIGRQVSQICDSGRWSPREGALRRLPDSQHSPIVDAAGMAPWRPMKALAAQADPMLERARRLGALTARLPALPVHDWLDRAASVVAEVTPEAAVLAALACKQGSIERLGAAGPEHEAITRDSKGAIRR